MPTSEVRQDSLGSPILSDFGTTLEEHVYNQIPKGLLSVN